MFDIKDAGNFLLRQARGDVRVGFYKRNMSGRDKLLVRATNSPNNCSFDDICELAESFGWVLRRQSGSHRIYENPLLNILDGRMQNFQNVHGKAKPYQVRQLVKAIKLLKK